MLELVSVPLGLRMYGPEWLAAYERMRTGSVVLDMVREAFREVGPLVLADTPGDREELRRLVDPRLVDIVDALRPEDVIVAATSAFGGYGVEGSRPTLAFTAVRIRDADGRLAGTAIITKPEASMSVLATLAAQGDLQHFERMQSVARAGRRPAAILFADLDPRPRWPEDCRQPAISRSADAWPVQLTSASSMPEGSWAVTSAMVSWRSSSPRRQALSRLPPAPAFRPRTRCGTR